MPRPKMDPDERKRKTHVNLTPADREYLDGLAEEYDVSLSGLLGLIVAYLRRRGPKLR